MKTILLASAILVVGVVVWIFLSMQTPNHYGDRFTGAPKVAVGDLLDRPTEFLGKRVTIEGTVQDQCPTTGCFFYFNAGDRQLKVELGDLAHSIPKKPGARVTVEGQLVPYGETYQFIGTAAEFQ